MENSTKNTEKSSIKIAVTSQNYRTVTKHAGLTRKVLVYDVQCSEDGKIKIEEMKDARIKLPKDMALNTCKQGVEHPIDIADVLVSGSCGEEFISNMARRGIIVSVTEKTDPVEAVKEFLENGTEHFTCDGPHQIKIKRHPNCLHN
ncbi:MAG: hypothetical protein KAJ40_05385, partial [Alphaproteobacteria bacterium]|nr:hypothetical protein [Alphaproteobacteria bacterium]